jgi:hypothetical protein
MKTLLLQAETMAGAGKLLDYGVLGIMLFLFIGVIIYQQKQNTAAIKMVMESKDREILYWQELSKKHDEQVHGILSEMSKNMTRLIDLYEAQQAIVKELPERIKLQMLAQKSIT